jgi:hypothetical protein
VAAGIHPGQAVDKRIYFHLHGPGMKRIIRIYELSVKSKVLSLIMLQPLRSMTFTVNIITILNEEDL